jgi:hypothetical protein
MAEEHSDLPHGDVLQSDIFHCLKCGRIAYEPHGTAPPPACCEQPMIRAVTGVATTGPVGGDVESPPEAIIEEYALLAEALELSHWSRTFPDADSARYTELAQRVASLATAVADQFHNEERAGELAKAIAGEAAHRAAAQRLQDEEETLLAAFGLLVDDLQQGAARFHGWAEVCDRLDALASAFRRHEEIESDLVRHVIHEGSSRQS